MQIQCFNNIVIQIAFVSKVLIFAKKKDLFNNAKVENVEKCKIMCIEISESQFSFF